MTNRDETPERRRIYWVWAEMLSRCRNEKHRQFHDYGGRGISVCERWTHFEYFCADMGDRPPGGLLDRIDNNGGYEPQNCKWSTRKQQNSNRRNCIYVEDNGESVTVKEYCRRHGLPYRPIMKRIQDRGWPISLALSLPIGSRRSAA